MRARPAWTASSARRTRSPRCGGSSARTWRSSRRASARPAPPPATRSAIMTPARGDRRRRRLYRRRRGRSWPRADPRRAAAAIVAEIEAAHLREKRMAKGYWIVRVDVSDPEAYQKYVAANAEPLAALRRPLPRPRRPLRMPRGRGARPQRHPRVPELRSGAGLLRRRRPTRRRRSSATAASVADFVIIEGYEGPQPGD